MMKKILLATILLATSLQAADLTLSWQDNSDNEDGFEIWRKVNDGNWELIGASNADVATFNDAVIPIGAILTYRVRAWNQFGESGFTNDVVVGTFPPNAPSGLTGAVKKSNGVSRAPEAIQEVKGGRIRTSRDELGRLIIERV